MMSRSWFKAFRRIVLTLALALTVTSTITTPPPADHEPHTIKPQVNWGS
jgi:hypothetical protein